MVPVHRNGEHFSADLRFTIGITLSSSPSKIEMSVLMKPRLVQSAIIVQPTQQGRSRSPGGLARKLDCVISGQWLCILSR